MGHQEAFARLLPWFYFCKTVPWSSQSWADIPFLPPTAAGIERQSRRPLRVKKRLRLLCEARAYCQSSITFSALVPGMLA
jgi:hypothetical protein